MEWEVIANGYAILSGVLIYVRMNIDYNQMSLKGVFSKQSLPSGPGLMVVKS